MFWLNLFGNSLQWPPAAGRLELAVATGRPELAASVVLICGAVISQPATSRNHVDQNSTPICHQFRRCQTQHHQTGYVMQHQAN